MHRIITTSRKDTVELGKKIGKRLRKGDIIAFRGGLGAGKTAFTAGIAEGLGFSANVVFSPTFSIVNEYKNNGTTLYHFDMYRITDEESLESTGFFDYPLENSVTVIEWSENISDYLPDNTITITIKILDETKREIRTEDGGRFDFLGD